MTHYDSHHSVFYHEERPLTYVIVDTDIFVSYEAFRGMSLGRIHATISEFLEWLKENEDQDIDPDKIRHNGKNAMTSTISFSYTRESTEEEIADYWKQKEQDKIDRKERLLEQLAEMEKE